MGFVEGTAVEMPLLVSMWKRKGFLFDQADGFAVDAADQPEFAVTETLYSHAVGDYFESKLRLIVIMTGKGCDSVAL